MGLRDFYKKTDAALQEAEAAATCKSCKEPYCCRMRVYAPIAAGELIAETLKDTPLLRDRLRDHIDDWDTGKLPCVFLEQGRCSIYPVRPLVCRAHFVTSPPKLCGEGLGGGGEGGRGVRWRSGKGWSTADES